MNTDLVVGQARWSFVTVAFIFLYVLLLTFVLSGLIRIPFEETANVLFGSILITAALLIALVIPLALREFGDGDYGEFILSLVLIATYFTMMFASYSSFFLYAQAAGATFPGHAVVAVWFQQTFQSFFDAVNSMLGLGKADGLWRQLVGPIAMVIFSGITSLFGRRANRRAIAEAENDDH